MGIDWIYGIAKWLHIVAVVIAIGGTFALRYVVLPSLAGFAPDDVSRFHQAARRKLGLWVPLAIGALLGSGAVNFVRALSLGVAPVYHMVFGIKFLLVLVLFTIAVALVLPGAEPNRFQRNRKFWLTMNAHLGFLIIALSVAMRFIDQ